MTDIVERLRNTALDKDNFPRMRQETWLPVGLGLEAADEIERLRTILEKIASLKHGQAAALAQSALDTMRALDKT